MPGGVSVGPAGLSVVLAGVSSVTGTCRLFSDGMQAFLVPLSVLVVTTGACGY